MHYNTFWVRIMTNYERKAHYHETDQMGVIHHANYLKWMEEARTDFLDQLGLTYANIEKLGVISPVTGISIDYKTPVLYNEIVYFNIKIKEYNGVKMTIEYEIRKKANDNLCVIATSKHCFLKDNKIISMKRELPDYHNILINHMENN